MADDWQKNSMLESVSAGVHRTERMKGRRQNLKSLTVVLSEEVRF